MWLASSSHAIAVCIFFYTITTTTTTTTKVHGCRALPPCSKCTELMGDIGATIEAVMGDLNLGMRKFCQVDKKTEEDCLRTKELVKKYVERFASSVFPEVAGERTKTLTCAHVLQLCNDVTPKGRELPKGVWDCQTCHAFFDLLFKFFKDPITDLNEILPSIFCQVDDKDCKLEFTTALNITGAIGQLLEEKRDASSVCRVTMNCQDDKRRSDW